MRRLKKYLLLDNYIIVISNSVFCMQIFVIPAKNQTNNTTNKNNSTDKFYYLAIHFWYIV